MSEYTDCPELVSRFLNYKLTIQNRSKLTVFQYYHDLRSFFRYMLKKSCGEKYKSVPFEEIPFKDTTEELILGVTSTDIYDFISFVTTERNNSASSRQRKLSCLRSFYKYLTVTIMKIENNPTSTIESPQKAKKLPKYLSLDESLQLLDSVQGNNSERDYAIITLFLNCGMRVSELAGINLSDINDDKTTLRVFGKGSKERLLYLNDSCRNAIQAYLKVRPKQENIRPEARNALFISRNRNRISIKTVQWLIYKRLKEGGLENRHMSAHKLRHTAATLMYQYGGTDVRILKDILGHEELSTTQIYTHVSSEQMSKAARDNPLSAIKRKPKNQTPDENDK